MASSYQDKDSDLAFRNVKVFTLQGEIMGLPSKLFIMGLGLTLMFGFVVRWWSAPLVAIAFFVPMYQIHKDDPLALEIWRRAMYRHCNYWQAGRRKALKLVKLHRQ